MEGKQRNCPLDLIMFALWTACHVNQITLDACTLIS